MSTAEWDLAGKLQKFLTPPLGKEHSVWMSCWSWEFPTVKSRWPFPWSWGWASRYTPLKIPGQKQCALRKVSTMGDGGLVSTTTSPPLFSPGQIQNLSVNQRLTTHYPASLLPVTDIGSYSYNPWSRGAEWRVMARKTDAKPNETRAWKKVSKEESGNHLSKLLFTPPLGWVKWPGVTGSVKAVFQRICRWPVAHYNTKKCKPMER